MVCVTLEDTVCIFLTCIIKCVSTIRRCVKKMTQIVRKKSLTCSDKVSAFLEEYVYPFSLSVKIKYHFLFCLSLQIAG